MMKARIFKLWLILCSYKGLANSYGRGFRMSGILEFFTKIYVGLNMKVSKYFKNLVRRFFNNQSHSNYTSGWGWRNVAPAGGPAKYGRPNQARPDNADKNGEVGFKKYTTAEVKAYLRGQQQSERARPVLQQASQISVLLQARMQRHFRGRERIFERLPYVLYQYSQGRDAQEIARSVSFFSDGEDVEQAMDFTARLIADHVNRANQRGGRF